MACGIYGYIFQEPQLAVSAGRSIQKGIVNTSFQGIGWTVLISIVIGIIGLGIKMCCIE